MNKIVYPQCIQEFYQGEVFGVAVFLALRNVAKTNRDKHQFMTLLQLESETKARLRPFLSKYKLDTVEQIDQAEIDGIVSLYQQNSWHDFVSALQKMVVPFITRYKEIERSGPDEDKSILHFMVEHEIAILNWLNMEISGENEDSLKPILDQLHCRLLQETTAE